jgi:hypothetical protein
MNDSKTITIRINSADYLALRKISQDELRSISWLCGQAIKEYLMVQDVRNPKEGRKS